MSTAVNTLEQQYSRPARHADGMERTSARRWEEHPVIKMNSLGCAEFWMGARVQLSVCNFPRD